MYKLMYDPTSFTPFFQPALSTICMGRFMPTPLYIVVLARFVGRLSGDSTESSICKCLILVISYGAICINISHIFFLYLLHFAHTNPLFA